MEKHLLVEYLDLRRTPTAAADGAAALHRALCAAAPDLYAHLLADPASDVSHKREVLANLLVHPAANAVPYARIRDGLRALPPAEAVRVLDVLPARRINCARARQTALAFLLGHEQLPELAAAHRQRLVRLLRHVLGERTWSSAARFLAAPSPEGERFLRRTLLRHAAQPAVARDALAFLADAPQAPAHPLLARHRAARADLNQGEGLPREVLTGLRGTFHRETPLGRVRFLAAAEPEAAAAHHDGPLTAFYREALTAEPAARDSDELASLLALAAAEAVAALPTVAGRLALVLDLSASGASSGERAYHPAALALALVRLLRERVGEVAVYQVGGSAALDDDPFPAPRGASDLAHAILRAARSAPDALVVLSDGYENVRPGDAAQVVAGLRRLGLTMPLYHVVPVYTAAEDIARRRLGAAIPSLPFEHEDRARDLLIRLMLTSLGDQLSPAEVERVRPLVAAR